MKIKIEHNNIITKQKQFVFDAFLNGIFFICLLFAYWNICRGTYLIAIVEIAISIFALAVFLLNKTMKSDQLFFYSAFVYLAIFSMCYLSLLVTGITSSNIYVWSYLIPPLVYFLLGKRTAFWFCAVFSLVSLILTRRLMIDNVSDEGSFHNVILSHCAIWGLSHVYESSNAIAKEQLSSLSLHDSLTKLYNRKALNEIYQHNRNVKTLTVLVLDIDFFKRVNDKYGHDGGDETLIFFAKEINSFFENVGYIVRMGGEEFCVLLPDMTIDDAQKLAEDFLQQLNSKVIYYKEHSFKISFSGGLAQYPREAKTFSELLTTADKRLYKAKKMGRNRIIAINSAE